MTPESRPTRRDFLRSLGIALAAVVLSRCTPSGNTPSTQTPFPGTTPRPTGTPPPPTAGGDNTLRDALRDCWLRFDWLVEQTRDGERPELGDEARSKLVAEHQAALDALVSAGELGAAVAEHVQTAYSAAVYHVWRSNAPITCYEPVLIDYMPTTSSQLVRQSDLLAEMAASSALDPDTVAQAQATIERDMAFLSLSNTDVQALYEELRQAAGDSYDFPHFDELELEISPEVAEAARFLVELLLEV